MSTDPVAAVRTILLADPTVSGLVGTRIFGEIDETEAKSQPRAAIVLKPAGGPKSPGGGYLQYGKTRIDVDCYGSTLNESYMVYLAAYDVLKAINSQVASNVLIHSCDTESKGSTARDPLKQWPVTVSSWLVLHAEIPAS